MKLGKPWRGIGLAAAAALFACGGGERTPPMTAERTPLIPIDSVALDESRSGSVLHRPNRVYGDDRGEILVSEFTSATVVRFDRGGRFLGSIGRAGRGPGEFVTPAMIAPLGDTLVVFDVGRREAQLFARDGVFLDSTFPIPFIANDVAVTDEAVWVTGIAFDSPWTALRWDRSTGRTSWSLPKPVEWARHPLLASLGGGHVAFHGDSGWAVFSGLDRAIRLGAGTVDSGGSFPIPVRLRRGVPIDRVAAGEYRSPSELFAEGSGTADASALPDGGLAVLFLDMTIDGAVRGGSYLLTTLAADGTPTCIDIPPDLGEYVQVRPRLRGDTLLALIQREHPEGSIRSIIKRWRIDPTACRAGP